MSRGGTLAVAVVVLCVAAFIPFSTERFGDFRAFYCSGRAVLARADPYREHPLRDCERSIQASGISILPDNAAIPAPFPGYVLALLAVLALVPFGVAAALWLATSVVAISLACLLFARCLRAPVSVLATLVGFPAVAGALELGQITPFIALAISAAALLLVRGRPRAAAFAALGIAFEPHVAAAVFVALFIAVRQTRVPLVAGCAALAMLSLVTLGAAANIEYVRDVLPAHALANLSDMQQFSAAHAASLFGAAPLVARAIGTWWYLVAAAAGVAIALRVKGRFGAPAIVLVPIAFEVFGGVYVHVAQLAFAIPAFLLVVPRAGRRRAAAVVALFFAAMPWNMIVNYPMLAPAIAVLAIALCVSMDVERVASPLATIAALLFLTCFLTGLLGSPHSERALAAYHPAANPLAQSSWQHWQESLAAQRSPSMRAWLIGVTLPAFAAFVALLGMLTLTAFRPICGAAVFPEDAIVVRGISTARS